MTTENVKSIRLDSISERARTRKLVDDAALGELAESIKAQGVLQPIIVRPSKDGKGQYELVAGWRRWKAARKAGLESIPSSVRELSDEEAEEIRLIENLQREDVHPLDEASAIAKLRKRYDWATVAARLGKPERYIRQHSHLVNLLAGVRDLYLKKQVGLEHALLICRQPESSQRSILDYLKREIRGGERSVAIEELRGYIEDSELAPLKKAPFDPADAKLVPGAGACSTCPKRSGNAPMLFEEEVGEDVCTDRKCYDSKVQAHIAVTLEQLRERAKENKQPAPLRLTTSWEVPKGMTPARDVAAAKPGSCPAVRQAMVVHTARHVRDEEHHLGTVHTVCDNQRCAVHRPGTSGRSGFDSTPTVKPMESVKRERAQELRTLTRKNVILGVAQRVKWDGVMLRAVAQEMWERVNFDGGRFLPYWMGWEKKPLPHPNHSGYRKQRAAMKDAELLRFLAITTLVNTWRSDYFGSRGGDLLPQLAQHFKVNWKKLEAQSRLELKPKWDRSDKARAGKVRKAKERVNQAKAEARKAAKAKPSKEE